MEDLFDESVRVPSYFTSGDNLKERSVRKAMERMRVFKNLAHWRGQYSVMWERSNSEEVRHVPLY